MRLSLILGFFSYCICILIRSFIHCIFTVFIADVLHTIVARAAEQFRDVLLTPPCASGALICDDAQLNGFEVIAFELFDAMRDCQTDVDVMVWSARICILALFCVSLYFFFS